MLHWGPNERSYILTELGSQPSNLSMVQGEMFQQQQVDVKLRTPGTTWYPMLLSPCSSNSATVTFIIYEAVLPGIEDFVGSTNS